MARVLIAGLPRSGTSWVGRVIGAAEGARFVHEPDGDYEPFAIRAKRGHARHIALDAHADLPAYNQLWSSAFAGGVRPTTIRARLAKRLVDSASLNERWDARRGAPTSVRMRAVLALAEPLEPDPGATHIVVKSVHCALAIEWIAAQFDPLVVVVERDPRNVLASWMKLGMGGDRHENVLLAKVARDRWGLEPPSENAPKIVQRTFVFGVLACGLREAASRHPQWIIVSHDDVCVDPMSKFRVVFDRLGLGFGDRAGGYISESNRPGEGFRTARLTSEQPTKWRDQLTENDVALVAQELRRFPCDLLWADRNST